jgi:hypothetical protein
MKRFTDRFSIGWGKESGSRRAARIVEEMSEAGPHFIRRASAPTTKRSDYRGFRQHVRQDFRKTCAYCLLDETWAAGPENFELDHFRPKSIFPQLALSYYNLYWSCHVCNRLKRDLWPARHLLERREYRYGYHRRTKPR